MPVSFVRRRIPLWALACCLAAALAWPAAAADPAAPAPATAAAPDWVRHPDQPFSITATEVTVGQFRGCVEAGACDAATANEACNLGHEERADHPLNCVAYYGAEQYCGHVGGRVCTEDEWLAACKGSEGRAFPYGQSYDAEACNARSSAAVVAGELTGTAAVKSHAGCEGGLAGLYDMAGNVAEWVDSCKDSYCRFRGAGHRSNEPVERFAGCAGVCSGNDKSLQSSVVGIRCCRDE